MNLKVIRKQLEQINHSNPKIHKPESHVLTHDMMLEQEWEKVAEKILEWLRTHGL